jgi:hypothetical protein
VLLLWLRRRRRLRHPRRRSFLQTAKRSAGLSREGLKVPRTREKKLDGEAWATVTW